MLLGLILFGTFAEPAQPRLNPPQVRRASPVARSMGQRPSAQTAIEAERAFARMAREQGQWTASRHYAAAEATMFVPAPVNPQDWLRGRADPSTSVVRSPRASYVSCDGNTAVNTGEWRRSDGRFGYFSTVWQRQADGQWRWIMDHGDTLTQPRGSASPVTIRRARCNPQGATPFPAYRHAGYVGPRQLLASRTVKDRAYRHAGYVGPRQQADGSLRFYFRLNDTHRPFPREFYAALWNGSAWELVIRDMVAAPAP